MSLIYLFLGFVSAISAIVAEEHGQLAKRDDFLFFNRVPKVGSQMMSALLTRLSIRNKFDLHHDGLHKYMQVYLDRDQENKLAKLLNIIPSPAAYIKHVPFVNFTRSHLPHPIYINMVRHPVERVISWFHYMRLPSVVSDHMKINPNKNVTQTWAKKDFETCVLERNPECQFLAGDSHKKGQAWSQMLFYCGMDYECNEPDGDWALARAKSNVEQAYAVVGVLEELQASLRAFEAKIPKFFAGASQLYEKHKDDLSVKNKNVNKPKISEKVKEFLKQGFSNEIEFYEFCKQRLLTPHHAKKY